MNVQSTILMRGTISARILLADAMPKGLIIDAPAGNKEGHKYTFGTPEVEPYASFSSKPPYATLRWEVIPGIQPREVLFELVKTCEQPFRLSYTVLEPEMLPGVIMIDDGSMIAIENVAKENIVFRQTQFTILAPSLDRLQELYIKLREGTLGDEKEIKKEYTWKN